MNERESYCLRTMENKTKLERRLLQVTGHFPVKNVFPHQNGKTKTGENEGKRHKGGTILDSVRLRAQPDSSPGSERT